MTAPRLATLLPIRNMNRAIRFYTKSLGAKLNMRAEGEMKDFWASLSLGKDEIWLITPEKREKRTLAYTAITVSNIKTYVRGLQRKGVKFARAIEMGPGSRIDGPISYGPMGASAFFSDSEGNVLMVYQNPPGM